MFDLKQFMDTPTEVHSLWQRNRDTQTPIPSRAAQVDSRFRADKVAAARTAIADGSLESDVKLGMAAARLLDELQKPDLAKTMPSLSIANDAEDGEEEEERDRLIVMPKRGGEEEEDEERFDSDFDGQRK